MNADFERFLYYGQSPLEEEVDFDIRVGLLQERRSLFYDRSHGAGVPEYENYPMGLSLELGLKYDVVTWISRRNAEVTDGSNGTRDRRAVTSQEAVSVEGKEGNLDVKVLYVPLGRPELRTVSV